ncbi:hypothetical protein H0H92_001385 [Tricholoma furcatifolium]|nr:hypothetical protein H0H92_001385 [Tricholoma furcatifolium]
MVCTPTAIIQALNALIAPGAPRVLMAIPIGSQGPITNPTQGVALLTDNQPQSLPSISVDASAGIEITPASDLDPSFEATCG